MSGDLLVEGSQKIETEASRLLQYCGCRCSHFGRGRENAEDASENNVKQEPMQCLTECRPPGEWSKEEAMGSSVLRLGDQRKDDITQMGES